MPERASSELLDQAITAVFSGACHVRNSALLAIRKYMQYSEANAFSVCRMVERYAGSENETERMLYDVAKEEAENF